MFLTKTLPEAKLIEIRNLRAFWEHEHPEPRSEKDWEEYAREVTRRTEAWLDQGHGACYFRETRWANDLRDRLHHFQNERYHLACWVIMPNHCHLVIRPFDEHDLKELIGGMKSVTARHITAELQLHGELWQQESYDRIIRDAEHLHRIIQYIGRNPAQAGVSRSSWFRWIDPAWQEAEWDFES